MISKLNSKLSGKRVLIIGDVMLDRYIWGDVNRISPEGPVPVVRVKERSQTLGGAANVALNLSTLGCSPVLTGITGTDSAGDELSLLLEKYNIENKLVRSTSYNTICKTRVVAQSQQLLRIDEETLSVNFDHESILTLVKSIINNIEAVIISDYAKGVCHENLLKPVLTLCNKKNIPVFVDPKRSDWTIYKGATCITPNKKEILLTMGEESQTEETIRLKAFSMLSKYDLKHILVTRGAEGMTLFSSETSAVHIPAKAKEVFDVSGAGDTVISTLAACVAAGMQMEDAARTANIAGGIVVGKIGTQPIYINELSLALDCASNNNHKLCSLEAARMQVIQWRSQGKVIVFTNGCFDLLHVGHIHLLHAAKDKGDRLIVGLNSDQSVRNIKGELRPLLPVYERAAILSALECVDLIVVFDDDKPLELLETLCPDVLVKGADYTRVTTEGYEVIEKYGGKVEIVPLIETTDSKTLMDKLMSL